MSKREKLQPLLVKTWVRNELKKLRDKDPQVKDYNQLIVKKFDIAHKDPGVEKRSVMMDISEHMDRYRTIHFNAGFYQLLIDQAKSEGKQSKVLLEEIVLNYITSYERENNEEDETTLPEDGL